MGRNALWLLGSRLTSDLLSFVLFLVVSRTFGPEGIGVYAYGFAIAGLMHSATTLGIDDFGIREYTRCQPEHRSKLISDLLGSQGWVAAIAVLVLCVYLTLTRPTPETLILIATLTVYQLCMSFSGTFFVPAMGEQHMRVPAVSNLVCRGLASIVAIVLVLSGATLTASMSVFGGAGLLALAVGIVSARQFGVRGKLNMTRDVFTNGVRTLWSFAAVEMLAQLFTRIGVIVLSLRASHAAAGVYATGLKLVEAACLPMLFGGMAAYPRLCRAFHDPLVFQRMSRWTLGWGAALTVACAAAMFVAVPWLLVPLLGPRYAGTEPLLSTMAALVLVQGIEIVCGRLLLAANLNVVRAAWVTLAGIACVAATLAAVPIFGVPGAIVCAVAAYLLLDVLYAYSLVGVLRARATAPNSAEVGGVGP